MRQVLVFLAAFAAAGCVAPALRTPLGREHPASPEARASAPSPLASVVPPDPFDRVVAAAPGAPAVKPAAAPDQAAATAAYTCPMHPDVVRDVPGTCPKCGMKLVPKEEPK